MNRQTLITSCADSQPHSQLINNDEQNNRVISNPYIVFVHIDKNLEPLYFYILLVSSEGIACFIFLNCVLLSTFCVIFRNNHIPFNHMMDEFSFFFSFLSFFYSFRIRKHCFWPCINRFVTKLKTDHEISFVL